jgi:hypothetical protein
MKPMLRKVWELLVLGGGGVLRGGDFYGGEGCGEVDECDECDCFHGLGFVDCFVRESEHGVAVL